MPAYFYQCTFNNLSVQIRWTHVLSFSLYRVKNVSLNVDFECNSWKFPVWIYGANRFLYWNHQSIMTDNNWLFIPLINIFTQLLFSQLFILSNNYIIHTHLQPFVCILTHCLYRYNFSLKTSVALGYVLYEFYLCKSSSRIKILLIDYFDVKSRY